MNTSTSRATQAPVNNTSDTCGYHQPSQKVLSFPTRWIATSVDIFNHPVLDDDGPFDRRSAWQWLIANACWRSREIRHKGKPLVLERGQIIIGRRFIAQQWRWTEQMVRSFINQCSRAGMLKLNQSNGHYANVATICNYDKYQSGAPEQSTGNNQSPPKLSTAINQTLTTTSLSSTKEDSYLAVSTCEDAMRETAEKKAPACEVKYLFLEALREAAAPCLAMKSHHLDDPTVPREWHERGFDLEKDILPTIRLIGARDRGKGILAWGYFTAAIREAHGARNGEGRRPADDDPRTIAWRKSAAGKQMVAARLDGAVPIRIIVRDDPDWAILLAYYRSHRRFEAFARMMADAKKWQLPADYAAIAGQVAQKSQA